MTPGANRSGSTRVADWIDTPIDGHRSARGVMDTHTLELLEFDKVRALVAAQAACSLGKEAALRMEPSLDPGEVRARQALTTEMADALGSGLTPPFGGLHDIRPQVRRAQVGGSLDPEELSGVVETL